MKKIKVALFTGNRAEYGLQYPLIRTLANDQRFEYYLLVSGAHLDDNFGHTIDEIEKAINESHFSDDPNVHAKELSVLIIKIASETIGKKFYYKGHKPWWNKQIKTMVKKTRRLSRRLSKLKKRNRRNIHKQSYLDHIKSLKDRLNKLYNK